MVIYGFIGLIIIGYVPLLKPKNNQKIFSSHIKKFVKEVPPASSKDVLCEPLLYLENLVDEVIKRNPDLAAAKSRVKAAGFVIPRVQAWDDPQFLFRAISNPIGSTSECIGARSAFTPERRYKFYQKIPFPGKLPLKGKIAEKQRDFIRSQEITTQYDLIIQAKKIYFQLYFNGIAHQINKQNRDIITRLMEGALALYKTGRGTQADALKAHIELQTLDDELLGLQSEKESLIAMLNAILDRPQTEFIGEPKVTFYDCFDLHYEYLEELAMCNRPELHGLQSMVDQEDLKAKLAKKEYFPDFDFEFMIQDKPERNKQAWGLNFGFNIPVWIPQKQRNEFREAQANAFANRSSLRNMESLISGRIREILANIQAAQERIILFGSGLLTKTAQTLASNESQYRVGKGDFLTVLDTRRQLHDFELDYERARIEREILLAELERTVGLPIVRIKKLSIRHSATMSKNDAKNKGEKGSAK